jgi:phenylalanyl-tRNA synthetase beta subunit
VEPEELTTLLRRLAALVEVQHHKNQSYDAIIEEQRETNQRLTLAIERIDRTLGQVAMTQASMERLLDRLFPSGENGRDA